MMRKGVKASIRLGSFVTVSAVALVGAVVYTREYELIPVVVTMLSAGPGLIALALGAKAWQSQAENRGPTAP